MHVLVIDDHPVVRQGVRQVLSDGCGDLVVGEAGSAREAMVRLRGARWDVVILDLSLRDRSGLELLKDLKAEWPDLPVLVLTIFVEEHYAARVLKAGAAGFLTKDAIPEELRTAVASVAHGQRYLSPSLAQKLAWQVGAKRGRSGHERLSDRELQVLGLIATGYRLTDAAKRLGLSVKTISTYRSRILTKMGLDTTAELIQYAIRNDLVL